MKAKIFAKLKQEYSPLGLGDEVLMSRAAALAETGLVTDENIDAVVAVQRTDLEGLQKFADKRVSSALDKERKKREEETQKKEEEAKAAEEEKKKKAAEEAAQKAKDEAERKAAEEASKKAAEEAARKKAAAQEAQKQNSDKAADKTAEDERQKELARKDEIITQLNEKLSTLADQFSQFVADGKRRDESYSESLNKLTESKTQLEGQLKSLMDESTAVKEAKAKAERKAKIEAKAKELGVPEWRINEGFTIEEDASDETISGVLAMVANNINTHLLPGSKGFNPMAGNEPTKEEVTKLAASLVK